MSQQSKLFYLKKENLSINGKPNEPLTYVALKSGIVKLREKMTMPQHNTVVEEFIELE